MKRWVKNQSWRWAYWDRAPHSTTHLLYVKEHREGKCVQNPHFHKILCRLGGYHDKSKHISLFYVAIFNA